MRKPERCDMPGKLKTNWLCPTCGLTARVPDVSRRVHCACGVVVECGAVVRQASGRPVQDTAASVPTFEHQKRLTICRSCDQYHKGRCNLVELGCCRSFNNVVWSVRGVCPAHKWPSGREPWITCTDLAAGAVELADQIPPDVTRVVGIPRSGMIPAAIIASKLHLPLYTIRDWEVVPAGGGFRTGWGQLDGAGGRWCFVDDTLHNGGTLRRLRAAGVPLDAHLTAVVYALNPSQCDLYFAALATPHLLEWNLLNTAYVQHLASDFDGIICHNPPHQDKPKYLSRCAAIKTIISARPESERQQSETWLARYGVQYQSLRLWPGTEADRWDIERVAAWKVQECVATGVEFYIESEPALADAMRRHGLRVLCPVQGYLA